MLAGAYRRDARVLNVGRRRKVRLSDAERHDVPALAHQPVDLGQDHERILGSEVLAAAADPECAGGWVERRIHRWPPCFACCAYSWRNVLPAGAGMSRASVQPRPSGRRWMS